MSAIRKIDRCPRTKFSNFFFSGIFSLKFWILFRQSSGFLIFRRLAESKFSRGGNIPARFIPIAFLHPSSKSRQKWKKLGFFDLNLIFSLARTLCKNMASNGVVLFSQFGYSRFSSVPTEIREKTSTKQKIKKMTHS